MSGAHYRTLLMFFTSPHKIATQFFGDPKNIVSAQTTADYAIAESYVNIGRCAGGRPEGL